MCFGFFQVPDHLEPGLNDRQLTRLLGLDIKCAEPTVITAVRPRKKSGVLDLSPVEIQQQLEKQKNNKWDSMVQGNLILKQGLVDKRKVSYFLCTFFAFHVVYFITFSSLHLKNGADESAISLNFG